jgi:hypothetical protein
MKSIRTLMNEFGHGHGLCFILKCFMKLVANWLCHVALISFWQNHDVVD